MKLPLKLAILVIVIFGLLTAVLLMWNPIRIRIYLEKFNSENMSDRLYAIDKLCEMGIRGKEALYSAFLKKYKSEQVIIDSGEIAAKLDLDTDKPPTELITLPTFYMDAFEVTNEKYYVFVKISGHKPPPHWTNGKVLDGEEKFPVVNVSWMDANAFSKWLNMRLPEDYEWEHAVRTGFKLDHLDNEDDEIPDPKDYAWNEENSEAKLHPVGMKKSDRHGLYDIFGNAGEWSGSFFKNDTSIRMEDKNYSKADLSEAYCVVTGGNYIDDSFRIGDRSLFLINEAEGGAIIDRERIEDFIGFRCVRDP